VSPDDILSQFGSLENLLVAMLNREFTAMWTQLLDDIERDPRGGLLSRIFRYTLPAIYERPLVRALYLVDPDGLNTIMRATNGFSYVPQFNLRAEFIRRMQEVGMVRAEVNPNELSAVLTAVSAGTALTAPHEQLDDINAGLSALLARAVDADVDDTSAGKVAFVEYALSLAQSGTLVQSDTLAESDDRH
jgi:AcrR family transcriptional regulator